LKRLNQGTFVISDLPRASLIKADPTKANLTQAVRGAHVPGNETDEVFEEFKKLDLKEIESCSDKTFF
jgi:hypothetical protein